MSTTFRRSLATLAAATVVAAAAPAHAAQDFGPGVSDAAQRSSATRTDERALTAPKGVEQRLPHPGLSQEAAAASAEERLPAPDHVVRDARGEFARSAGEPAARIVTVDVGPAPSGLDWTAVGLGAGGGVALIALTAGGLLITRRSRGTRLAG